MLHREGLGMQFEVCPFLLIMHGLACDHQYLRNAAAIYNAVTAPSCWRSGSFACFNMSSTRYPALRMEIKPWPISCEPEWHTWLLFQRLAPLFTALLGLAWPCLIIYFNKSDYGICYNFFLREIFSTQGGITHGKIDLDKFCEILTHVGFEEEEACHMFEEIRGGEEITLQDFQSWWKKDNVRVNSTLNSYSPLNILYRILVGRKTMWEWIPH